MKVRRKKRVAIIIPGGIGGGYFKQGVPVLEDFVQRMALKYDVTVYSMIKVEPSYVPQGFVLKDIHAKRDHLNSYKILLTFFSFVVDHFNAKYDLLHGIWGFPSGLLAILLGKLLSIPTVVSLQGGEAANLPKINYGNMLSPRIRLLTLCVCRKADCLTVLTNYQINELRKFGFKRTDVHVIPYGVNKDRFVFKEKTLILPIRFIHVANLTMVKDQQMLLRAFKIISDNVNSKLQIVGEGESRVELELLCQTLGIQDQVEMLGAVSNSELPQYLGGAHIMLQTSLYEGQGVSIVEAAASGVVVCGTHVGLMVDWGNELCVTVAIGDYNQLAEEVLTLLKDSLKYKTLQKDAHSWSMKNNANYTAHQFDLLYQKSLYAN